MKGVLRHEEQPDRKRDYQHVEGRYYFKINGEEYSLDEDTLAEIQHRYSFSGDNWTQQEISITYNIPRKLLEVILRKAGIFKASPAWTRERIEAIEDVAEFDDLVSATYEARSHSLQAKSMRLELREMRKELDKYREVDFLEQRRHTLFEGTVRSLGRGFRARATRKLASATRKGPDTEPWVAHVPLADLHGGMYVWGREQWGGDFDTEIAAETVVQHALDSAAWICAQRGRCEAVYFTDVGDFFHGIGGATERGTPMHQDTRSKKVIGELTEAKFEAVEIMRKVAGRVVLMGSNGNHDHLFHYDLFRSLRYYFRGQEDVEVYDALRPEAEFLVGDTAHVLIHGRGIGRLGTPANKVKLDVLVQEVEARLPEAKRFVTYVGHLHEVEVATHGRKTLMKRLPAACPTDDYAQGLFFSHRPGAQAFRLDAEGRIEDEHNTYFSYHGEAGSSASEAMEAAS